MSKRRLYVLRHAKSDWSGGQSDHQRPLAPRGQRDAPRVGSWLSRIEAAPDWIACSSATRTQQTASLAFEAGAWTAVTETFTQLYHASSESLAGVLRQAPAETLRPMLVAHQPGCSEFVSRAIGGGSVRFPTAAVAALRPRWSAGSSSDWSWGNWSWGDWELEWLVTPKGLGD